jgi:hypothetical protein
MKGSFTTFLDTFYYKAFAEVAVMDGSSLDASSPMPEDFPVPVIDHGD